MPFRADFSGAAGSRNDWRASGPSADKLLPPTTMNLRTPLRIALITCVVALAIWVIWSRGWSISSAGGVDASIPVSDREPSRQQTVLSAEQEKEWAEARRRVVKQIPKGAKVLDRREMIAVERSYRPLLGKAELIEFLKTHQTPGAYVAAAGALRDKEMFKEGLRLFPDAPVLHAAAAMMNNAYLKDPALLEAWMQSDPENGWPKILKAEILLGKGDAASAYKAVVEGLQKNLPAGAPAPEIAVLTEQFKLHKMPPHFRDLRGDMSLGAGRIAGDLLEAAKNAATPEDKKLYSAASLAIMDQQTDSACSETARAAAVAAIKALEVLGEDNSAEFTAGVSHADVIARYSEIMARCDAARKEAKQLRSTLAPAELKRFDELRDEYGPAAALEMFLITRGE